MTVEEALAVVDAVFAQAVGTRADHDRMSEALEVLRQSVTDDAS